MIREATLEDIPALLAMGAEFQALARVDEHVGYDEASVAQTLAHLIEGDAGVVLMSENGAIGGMVHPHPFNLSVTVGQELFWWSKGGGSALLDALEEAARAKGAQFWTMITLQAARPEAVGRLYERRGYRALEHSYIKRL